MSRFKVFCTMVVLSIAGCVATAQTPVANVFGNLNKVIPDGQPTGVSNMGNLPFSDPGITPFTGLKVTLTIANGHNGDFYSHLVQEGAAGHYVAPEVVVDTDPQISLVSTFNGTDPNGSWTLFLTDVDFGDQGTLANWRLAVTAIPEPSALTLLGLGGVACGMRLLRRRTAR
jgi:subtilisin-like proprotein convertase family protein